MLAAGSWGDVNALVVHLPWGGPCLLVASSPALVIFMRCKTLPTLGREKVSLLVILVILLKVSQGIFEGSKACSLLTCHSALVAQGTRTEPINLTSLLLFWLLGGLLLGKACNHYFLFWDTFCVFVSLPLGLSSIFYANVYFVGFSN